MTGVIRSTARRLFHPQIQEAGKLGVTFGAHTCTHPILSRLAGPEETELEISGSRQRLEHRIAQPVIAFAYPNGRPEDIGDTAVDAVRRSEFRDGVSNHRGIAPPPLRPFASAAVRHGPRPPSALLPPATRRISFSLRNL